MSGHAFASITTSSGRGSGGSSGAAAAGSVRNADTAALLPQVLLRWQQLRPIATADGSAPGHRRGSLALGSGGAGDATARLLMMLQQQGSDSEVLTLSQCMQISVSVHADIHCVLRLVTCTTLEASGTAAAATPASTAVATAAQLSDALFSAHPLRLASLYPTGGSGGPTSEAALRLYILHSLLGEQLPELGRHWGCAARARALRACSGGSAVAIDALDAALLAWLRTAMAAAAGTEAKAVKAVAASWDAALWDGWHAVFQLALNTLKQPRLQVRSFPSVPTSLH
jgi:hypothetical protein